jgi:hypothetical protein
LLVDAASDDGVVIGLGYAVSEIILAPLGVHLVNRRRGNYALDLAASAAIGVTGILLAAEFGDDQRPRQALYLSLAALTQIATVVSLERRAVRR